MGFYMLLDQWLEKNVKHIFNCGIFFYINNDLVTLLCVFAGLSSNPLRKTVKHQLLYCRAGIGFHLQILPDGLVEGVHRPTPYCEFKPNIKTLKPNPEL